METPSNYQKNIFSAKSGDLFTNELTNNNKNKSCAIPKICVEDFDERKDITATPMVNINQTSESLVSSDCTPDQNVSNFTAVDDVSGNIITISC